MFVMVFGFGIQAEADLINRGTDSLGNRLIYDTDYDITWYDFTRMADTWNNQMSWAAELVVSGGNLTGSYDDWRLPTALNQDGTGPTYGYSSGSELGHLYYAELGNLPQYVGYNGLSNTDDFQNLQAGLYWSNTVIPDYWAWEFNTSNGYLSNYLKGKTNHAIAVRSGNVAVVPEPVSSALFLAGAGIVGLRRSKRNS